MNTVRKPLLTEAVLLFSERGIAKEMLYPEFEALLDGLVSSPEFADETVEAVFLQISNRLHVRGAVFFTIDFDLDGNINSLWNMPLRNMVEKAGRGPDMGGGPIRLVCLGFASDTKYRPHLWKPGQRGGRSDLLMIKEAVTRNTLGILGDDEETLTVLQTDRLQVAAEDAWYGGVNNVVPIDGANQSAVSDSASAVDARAAERARQDAEIAELHEQIDQLVQQKHAELIALRQQHEDNLAIIQGELGDIKNELAQQQKLNVALKRDLSRLQSRTPSDVE
ncbi:chromosome segregation ATPase [Halopseudomonas pelagia]|uniref:chromosome segregation ATPase n=1 Tax=Halopseudomonas pelagia TaxID=553151 RepID=UPI00039FEEE4|nr:chromosome segregation ATPase [Halopseudomonas pelagia]